MMFTWFTELRFVSSFCNTKIKEGREILPFSLFSVYADYSIHHEVSVTSCSIEAIEIKGFSADHVTNSQ